MRRIDENTYIDDSLVSCAEYQLFIDEMREQGKYYQPDHWNSFQFPKGQAHNPIVGVRFNDAKTFCEWLSKKEAGEWSFRLPKSIEAVRTELENVNQSPIGYWDIGVNSKNKFVWVNPIIFDPKEIVIKLKGDLTYDLDFSQLIKINGFRKTIRNIFARKDNIDLLVQNKELPISIDHICARNLEIKDGNLLDSVRELAISRAHIFGNAFYNTLFFSINQTILLKTNFSKVYDLDRDFVRLIQQSCFRPLDLDSVLDSSDYHNYDKILDFAGVNSRSIYQLFPRALKLDIDHFISYFYAFMISGAIYLDILKLQERIAGRSPAFEGIRIVKERKT